MSRLNSFFLASDHWPRAGEDILLEGPEARHMLQVLRTMPGTEVRLFDGEGRTGHFVLVESAKRKAVLRPGSVRRHPARRAGVTLALAWSKASRRGWLLEKSVELYGNGVAFWRSERSQGALPKTVKDSWKEKIVQSAKQCGNPWLPHLYTIGGIQDLITFAAGFEQRFLLWESPQLGTLLQPDMLSHGRSLAVIGPEGGITEQEAEHLQEADFLPVSLGKSVLRWETAALHCLSLAFHGLMTASQTNGDV